MAADQRKSDMVMRFVGPSGAVDAECMLGKDPDDPMMTDFNPGQNNSLSDFFEVTKFDFGVEVKDEDKTKKSLADRTHAELKATTFDANTARVKGSFVSWRAATDDEVKQKKIKLNVEFETFSFTKLIDRASPIFFKACLNSQTFEKATLVKRAGTGNQHPVGFFKIDFSKVLIIGLDWDDGGLVSETCKFICRGFTVGYRPQKPDGSLGETVPATWTPPTEQ